MIRSAARLRFLPAAALLCAAAACTDGDAATGAGSGAAHISFAPSFMHVAGHVAADVNRIRLTARQEGSNAILATAIENVDPAQSSWALELELPITRETQITVLVELISVTGGAESVEWSGLLGPITVRTGATPAPFGVQVFPGPAENLGVTAIDIAQPASLVEGSSAPLQVTMQGGGSGARAIFTSSNPAVATVDATGRVTALVPGTTRITATAGRVSDAVDVTVTARAASVDITPDSIMIDAIGATAEMQARVLDPRGAEIPGGQVTWSSADPAVAVSLGNGVFRAVGNGRTTITAEGPGGVRGTAVIVVAQRIATVAVTPATRSLDIGATATLTAVARDPNGNTVPGVTFAWSSSNAAVASVDNAGLVTARAVGSATITASAGGVSGNASINVTSPIATIEVSPARVDFTNDTQTRQLTAIARDAAGNVVPDVTFTWSSTNEAVATVSTSGLVDAVAPGTATINAVAAGRTGSAQVVFQLATASLAGRVVSGTTGEPIPGASVTLRSGTEVVQTATASGTGSYAINAIAAGDYSVTVTADGYASLTQSVTFADGQAIERNFAIVPTAPAGQLRIVLTWNAAPQDLDSYLVVPANGSNPSYTISYSDQGSALEYPFAALDVDDTDGNGPETITIYQQLAGTYTFSVHNYSGEVPLNASGARVEVYRGDTLIASFTQPSGTGVVWHVFSLNGTTLTPINTVGDEFLRASALRAGKGAGNQ